MAAEDKENQPEEVAQNPETEEADAKADDGLSELEKYWKTVRDDPADFTGWTYLLQYVEQEGNVDNARMAFDAFLERYPYCYGYWKKYSDMEKKSDDPSRVEQVLEAGVMAIPLSIDLWVHYIQHTQTKLEKSPDKEAIIRRLFERAIAAAGKEFRSDKLWEMFIQWERDNKLYKNVTELYDRVLQVPTQLYSHHFEYFKEHVQAFHPKDILRLDEFLRLRKEVLAKKNGTKVEEEEDAADCAPPGDGEAPPGLEIEASINPDLSSAATHLDDSEVPLLRDKIIEIREQVHRANEQEVSKRWSFEEAIRRPYFHVKPLEKNQLKNWRDYLNFEIETGCHERIVVLFERCMIACALYEEFWLKYANYMESHSVEAVRNVYKRACTVHLKRKPNVHLAWAAFEERQGNHEEALNILKNLEAYVPGLALVAMRRIGMERRKGNFADLETMYNKYIEEADDNQVKSFFAIKYARFLAKVLGNTDKALTVLKEALERDPDNPKLHLQVIDYEYQRPSLNEQELSDILDRAINANVSLEYKVAFSQRRLEFLEDFGSNIGRIAAAYTEHQQLLKESQTTKKRKIEDTEDSEAKKAKTSTEAVVANGNTDPNAAAQQAAMDPNAYNYQQWAQYGAYGAYQQGWGGYGNYYGTQ